jgi:hypothetical protein
VDGLEDIACQDRKGRALKVAIGHVASHDLIILAHALDHQILDQLADAELKLVERVGECSLNDLRIPARPFLDLLEEEAILLGKLRPETLVQQLDDR